MTTLSAEKRAELRAYVDDLTRAAEHEAVLSRADLLALLDMVEAPASALDTARAEIERLRAALAFYRDGFTFITDKRRPGLAWVPTETLLDDCGNIARATLSPAVKESPNA